MLISQRCSELVAAVSLVEAQLRENCACVFFGGLFSIQPLKILTLGKLSERSSPADVVGLARVLQ